MNSGMYAALSGSVASQQRLDVLANNLANVNTAGFKRDRMVFESMLAAVKNPSQESGTLTDTTSIPKINFTTDYSAGPVKATENSLDVALDGDGFFVLETPQGKGYTRQGNFHLDAGGRMVSAAGYPVLGNGGPITIKGGSVKIDASGGVFVDGNRVAGIDLVDFPKPYPLEKKGETLFIPAASGASETPAKNTSVRQGFLEQSNVNPILEMTQLIETTRYYESCLKALRNYDEIAGKAANELGKV